jgi:hypothetical protein
MKSTFLPLSLFSTAVLTSGLLMGCGEPPPGPNPAATGGVGTIGGTGGAGSGGGATTGGATGSGGGASMTSSVCGSADSPYKIVADEPNNMTLTSDLILNSPQTVVGGNMDMVLDWTGLTTDFYMHPLDPSQINLVALVIWDVGVQEIAHLINTDDPALKSHVILPVQFDPKATGTPVTSATLREFTDPGGIPVTERDVQENLNAEKGYTFTLIVQDDPDTYGIGARMIQAFTVDDATGASTVTMSDASTTLIADATFGTPVQVPMGSTDLQVEWASSIDLRSFGGEFKDNGISEVLIGQYEPGVDLADGILDIEISYKNLYRGYVPVGSTFDLSTLVDEAGQSFPGIDGTDQWLLGLLCTTDTCTNPTPWYLTTLQPCP